MKKIKINLRSFHLRCFILLLIGMTLVNCETEQDFVEQESHDEGFLKIPFEQFKANTAAYQKLSTVRKEKPSHSFQRYVYDEKYGAFIDPDNIIMITKENLKYYTIPMKKEANDTLVKNLVLSEKEDGSYTARVFGYKLTQEEIAQLKEGIQVALDQKTYIKEFDEGQNTFTPFVYARVFYDECGSFTFFQWVCPDCHRPYMHPQCGVQDTKEPILVIKHVKVFCIEEGPGGPGGGPDPSFPNYGDGPMNGGNNGNNGGGGGGGSTNNPSSPSNPNFNNEGGEKDYTTPVMPGMGDANGNTNGYNLATEIKKCITNLSNQQFNYLMVSDNCPQEKLNYLTLNSCSLESKQVVLAMLNSEMNGGEIDCEYRVIVDKSLKDNPCLYGVYSQLGKAPAFQNYLQNFDGNFSVANLRLTTSSNLPNTVNAETSPPSNYLVTITFNSNNLSRPSLSIARTFIHELIHAEIFRKLLECASMPNLNFPNYTDSQWRNFITNLRNNYPGLYDYYLRYLFNVPAGQMTTDEQHQLMAQHYRNVIVQALKQFDNTQPDNVYEALAWEGLKDTVAWTNLSQTEQSNINQVITTFYNSNTNCQ